MIPEGLGKAGMSDVRVAESREIPDYREARAAAFCSPAWGRRGDPGVGGQRGPRARGISRPAAGDRGGQLRGKTSLVACYVPDLERYVILPLREAGFADERIAALGEVGLA